jgi:hypothetical protein
MTELFLLAFKIPLNPALIKWKYFDNPAGPAIWMGIFHGDILIGSGAMLPEKMSVFSEVKTVYKCTDLMIHPSYQGKGLASLINSSLREQVQSLGPVFSYTICSKNATSNFKKNGWVHMGAVINYFKPGLLLKLSNLVNGSSNNIKIFDPKPGLFKSYPFHHDSAKVSVAKSGEFMDWRTQNPNFSYKVIGHFSGNEMNGYLIYSVGSSGVLNIIDVDAVDENKKIYKTLFKAMEKESGKTGAKGVIGLTIAASSFSRVLAARGYFTNPFKKGPLISIMDFNILPGTDKNEKLKAPENWLVYGVLYDDI